MTALDQGTAEVYDAVGLARFGAAMLGPVLTLVRRHRGRVRRALDLACGAGAAAVHLAREGYQVVGVDRSEAMLARARERAAREGVQVTWLQQDMRELEVAPPVDLVTCLFDSVNHLLEPEDVRRTFRRVRQALAPGGLFVFDVTTISALAQEWGDATWIEADTPEVFLAVTTDYSYDTAVLTLHLTGFVRQGEGYRRFQEVRRERGYPLHELRRWLVGAGLSVVGAYDYPSLGAASEDGQRVLFVARRRKGRRSAAEREGGRDDGRA